MHLLRLLHDVAQLGLEQNVAPGLCHQVDPPKQADAANQAIHESVEIILEDGENVVECMECNQV